MKNLAVTLIFALFVAITPASALAQTDTGPTPGSFWYGISTTFENINLFFTFNAEKKAEKALNYAERRLAQAASAAENENVEAVETALADYETKINLASASSKKIKDGARAEKLLTSIADNTTKHQETLSEVLEKVPEEAREAIAKAIEVSKRGKEEATRQITELKGEVEQLRQELAELRAKEEKRETEIEEANPQTDEIKPQTTQSTKSTVPPVSESATPSKTVPTQAPAKPVEQPAPKISTDSLGSELLKFLNAQLTEQIRSDLDYYTRTVSDVRDLINLQKDIAQKGEQNCLTSYNSKVEYAKSDAQRQKTTAQESQRGFASSPALYQNIDAQLERDLQDIEYWKDDCLAKYSVNTSLESRLNQVNSSLNSIRQRFNSSNASVSSSDISSIRNELLSISNSLASSLGVSGSLSLPSIRTQPSSVTCTNDVSGFACRDNFGSHVMRCSQSAPGFLNCSDSNYKNVSCQSGTIPGSVRCSW